MTNLDKSSRRINWKKSTFLIAHSWRSSSISAYAVAHSLKPVAVSLAPLALASRFQTMRIGSANTSVALVWSSRRSKIGRPDLSNGNGGRFRARRYHAVCQQQEPPEQCELWTRHLKQTPARSLAAGITLGKGLTEERILECIVSLPRYIQNLSEPGLLMKMV